MSKATRATRMLEQAGVAFTVHSYDYDPGADRIGLQAAAAIGEDPARVLKSLKKVEEQGLSGDDAIMAAFEENVKGGH